MNEASDFEEGMGSINHSLTQAKIARLLINDRFSVMTELSLDISSHDFSQYGIKAKEDISVPDGVCNPVRDVKHRGM